MIGYVCKYTPVDILESFGEYAYKINTPSQSFKTAECMMHSNMCCYSKAVIEECYINNVKKIVLVNCCDSIRRLYDNLKNDKHFEFVHMIDLPRKINKYSNKLFVNEILNLIHAYEVYSNKKFMTHNLLNIIKNKLAQSSSVNANNKEITIIGARCENYILDMIKENGYTPNDLTCTGSTIDYSNIDLSSYKNLIYSYCSEILKQFPCMRMCDIEERYKKIKAMENNMKGIIYHTIKFCDYYPFDYVELKKLINVPIVKIETDFTLQSKGQIKTRLDAFIESISRDYSNLSNKNKIPKTTNKNNSNTNSIKFVAGIDSGSTSTNVVIMDSNKNILSSSVVRTGAKSLEGAKKALNIALNKANIKLDELSYIVSTGYGRVSIPFANKEVTEITCHAKGAHFINKGVRTIIDIGGQDSKAISINKDGDVKDFAMNDKCAAGTGRFLENMAKVLEIDINDMGNEALKSNKNITITSMCTVFAESEVVSLIAQNNNKCDIINGLCRSISNRTASLVNRIGKVDKVMMTGGVAKNIGVVTSLEDILNTKIIVPKDPQIVGAIGACIIALSKI